MSKIENLENIIKKLKASKKSDKVELEKLVEEWVGFGEETGKVEQGIGKSTKNISRRQKKKEAKLKMRERTANARQKLAEKRSLEREAKRGNIRAIFQARFAAVNQSFCISQQDLNKDIQKEFSGIEAEHIVEEIPNFFDLLIPGMLIRKNKTDIDDDMSDEVCIRRQFLKCFIFLFGEIEKNPALMEPDTLPSIKHEFLIRSSLPNFEGLWNTTLLEAIDFNFDVVEKVNPIDGTIEKSYQKKSIFPRTLPVQ